MEEGRMLRHFIMKFSKNLKVCQMVCIEIYLNSEIQQRG